MEFKYKFFWLSVGILCIALFLPIDGKAAGPSFDKVVHLMLFAFVSLNACFYFLAEKKYLLRIITSIFLFAPVSEYLQTFIVGRNFEVKDIVADVLGVIVGIIVYHFFKNQINKLYALFGEHPSV